MKFFMFFTLILLSCSSKKLSNKSSNSTINKNVEQNQLQTKDTSPLSEPYVIYYYPDSLSRIKLVEINGEDGLDAVIQDNTEYFFPILQYLDSLKIKTTIEDSEYLILKNRDSIKRNSLDNPYFGLLLIKKNHTYISLDSDNYKMVLKKLM